MPINYSGYSTLKQTWIKPTKNQKHTTEQFGAFSISAAVRGSYCNSCSNYGNPNNPRYNTQGIN